MSQTIAGALVGGALGAYGSKVKIPDLPAIDPQQVQATTIANNNAALPGLEQLGSAVNSFNTKEQLARLTQALNMLAPGGLQKMQQITSDELAGNVSSDVAAQIQRQSVAGAYGRGYGAGSTPGMNSIGQNDFARNYGITSYMQQQQGKQDFGNLASLAPKTPLWDMTSMFQTPQQALDNAFRERASQFNVNLLKAQVAAAPDPNMVQLAQGFDNFFKTWASVGMGAMGGSVQGSGAPQPGGTGGGIPMGAGSGSSSSDSNGTLGGWDNTGGGASGFA